MKILKAVTFIIITISIFAAGLAAQTNSEISIEGVLNKSNTENKYSIGEYFVQLPADKQDSYEFYFDPYVGQNIKFRGNLIDEKLIEGKDIWYGANIDPTKDDYPNIVKFAKNAEDFIPNDWVILQRAFGDLNGDNQEDVVWAIRGNNLKYFRFSYDVRGKRQYLLNPVSNVSGFGTDGNPRILLVLLKEKDGYRLQTQNNSFLPISRFGVGETLDKIEIIDGKLELHFSYGDPHWGFIEKDFTFKFTNSEMNILSGKFTKNLRYAESGIYEYDFAGKQIKVTTVDKESGDKKTELKKLKFSKLLNLNTLTDFNDVEKFVAIVK